MIHVLDMINCGINDVRKVDFDQMLELAQMIHSKLSSYFFNIIVHTISKTLIQGLVLLNLSGDYILWRMVTTFVCLTLLCRRVTSPATLCNKYGPVAANSTVRILTSVFLRYFARVRKTTKNGVCQMSTHGWSAII